MSYYRDGTLPPGLDNFNVYLMTVSPPDANGFVNFGEFQIMSKLLARAASLVIAEIDPASIRIGGDNEMHISEIDYFVESRVKGPPPHINPPPVSDTAKPTAPSISRLLPPH